MTSEASRRDFLRLASLAGATLLAGGSHAPALGAAPEAGASNAAAPSLGATPLASKPLPPKVLKTTGISQATHEEHYKLYQGYIKKTNEIMDKLKTVDLAGANQSFSDLRSLKVGLSFALGGVKNHEIYFDAMGGPGGPAPGKLGERIARDFGSHEKWVAEFKACGLAARGWVWLAWDRDLGRLMNYLGDAQNTFPIWNSAIVLPMDVYEHAYYLDFKTNRAAYVDAFLANVDWDVAARRADEAGALR
jgi:Fe-Mn family superoxide dismutase